LTIRGIVFDKDGTLLDFNATWIPVHRAVALIVAAGNHVIATKILEESGQDDERGVVASNSLLAAGTIHEIAEVWQKYAPEKSVDQLAQLINGVGVSVSAYTAEAVPELHATIRGFAEQGIKIGLATSDSYESAMGVLARFELIDEFDFVCGYDSGFGVKPGPGMVLGFCQETGCRADEVCVVGDNAHDMEMAKAANAALRIGVLSGTSEARHLDPIADHVLASIAELPDLIDAFNSGEKL